jgi:hypothetical protein
MSFLNDEKGISPLNPFKQSAKEIRDGKQIGEDQRPDHDSFDIDLDFPNLFFHLNAYQLFMVHSIPRHSSIHLLNRLHSFVQPNNLWSNLQDDFSQPLRMQKLLQ